MEDDFEKVPNNQPDEGRSDTLGGGEASHTEQPPCELVS